MLTLKKSHLNTDHNDLQELVPAVTCARGIPQSQPLVCEIIELGTDGYPVIHYGQRALRADSLVEIEAGHQGKRCLAMIPDNNQEIPVILGLLWQPRETPSKTFVSDNLNVVIEAGESLSLSCGKSNLTLEANGTVRLQGVTVTSQAYGSNRIKGAAVKIN